MTPTAEQPSSLPGLSDTRLEEIAGQINRAHDMVSALCHGKREWIMSIPAEPDRDPDLVIGDGLQAGRDLFREVRRLQGELAAAREATAQAVRAERRCCAQIADDEASKSDDIDAGYLSAQRIARKIRSRSLPGETADA